MINTTHNELPAALTCTEVARVLRVNRKTVYALIDRRKLPCIGAGKAKRIPTQALVDLLGSDLLRSALWSGVPRSEDR